MHQSFKEKCVELEEKVRVLEEENADLSERAEEFLLLGLVSESIQNIDDQDELIERVLERCSILKSIPYCACYSIHKTATELITAYTLLSDDPSFRVRLSLSPSIIRDLKQGPYILYNRIHEAKDLLIDIHYTNFTPQAIAIVSFESRTIPNGIFVFIDNDLTEDRLSPMIVLLQQVVDMVVARLDKISLLSELVKINAELDHRVEKRTEELLRSNKRLQNEILERKQAEAALRESEERYQSVSELTSDFSYAFRVGPDGELKNEWVTGAIKRFTGFTREEVISRGGWESLIYPEDMSIPLEQFKSLLSNQSKTVEYRIIDKAGKIHWMRDFAKPLWDEKENRLKRIFGAAQEITEQKEAEEALQSSHERFLTVLDSIDATIYVADMETYKILFMNKNMIESFGRDMTGEICWEVFRGQSEPCPHCTNDRLVDAQGEPTGVYIWQTENPITGKWYINYDRAIKWIDDRLVRLQIATDITELKRLEKERKQFDEKLRQGQKMEAIGTLAGGIAHDFNNILFPQLGFTEMLRDDLPADSPLQKHVDGILQATLRLRDLVKQILAFSRKGDQDLKPIRLQPIVKEVVKLLNSSIPTTIDIQQEIDPGCGVAFADPTQVHQIIMNLATNAYHAMEETGGRLTVTLKQVGLKSDQALLSELVPGDYALLSVADTGTGIPKSVLDRVFDPYFTTKELDKGTGLGLSVVQGIVKSINGDIHIDSEPGKGTEIQVYLPIMKSEVEDLKVGQSETVLGGTEKILLVDDDEAILKMGQQMLERLGYQVVVHTGSVDALETFRSDPDRFDIVVTDMTMPKMTGIQFSGELKKIRPNIPVILCTGFSHQVNDEKRKALGIDGFLMKPVRMKEMGEVIRKVLD